MEMDIVTAQKILGKSTNIEVFIDGWGHFTFYPSWITEQEIQAMESLKREFHYEFSPLGEK